MSDKKSVSAFRVLRSAFGELQDDPFMFIILLAPIYLFTAISFTFNDFIIVYNTDFEYYNYSSNTYYVSLIYILIESYVFSLIAVAIHNNIIRKEITVKLFSKASIIYSLVYLSNYGEFLINFCRNNFNELMAIPLIIIIFLVIIIFGFTAFLWMLYLPNISVNDKNSFFYIFKNSYGARLTIIIQAIYLIPIFLIPYLILSLLGGIKFGIIFTIPFIFVLAVTMLSHTYLEWQELERNTAENNK